MNEPSLQRNLGLLLLTFYGLGTILGAGIYSLIGEVAKSAGMYAPLAFVVAAIIAGFTGLSYAELSARFPRSAGEAVYVQEGLGWPRLSLLVGLMIVLTGTVSSATLANAFIGYAQKLVELFSSAQFVEQAWYLDRMFLMSLMVLGMGLLAVWGIRESVTFASLFTVIEIGGLLMIIYVSGEQLGDIPARFDELVPPLQPAVWSGILIGAFVAFYAFIGFEDMVNVAEEVRNPQVMMPRAILIAIVVSTVLYLLVALSAVLALPQTALVQSTAPMAAIYQHATGRDPWVITLISLFAVLNGVLIQMIMASRVLYGMSRQSWVPALLGRVHPRTHTPVYATLVVVALVLLFALPLNLRALADTTSFIILLVFILVNLSLIRIKLRAPRVAGTRMVPLWVPVLGLLFSCAFVLLKLQQLIAG